MPRLKKNPSGRRAFLKSAAGAVAVAGGAAAQQTGRVRGFDHVALPMQNTQAMVGFYRALGWEVVENATAFSVYCGDNMINFHRPERWQSKDFTLRAPAAKPPCGDLCFVWEGTPDALRAMLNRAQAKIIEGPGPRRGARKKEGSSTYVRDPDGNLLEFMIYS